MSMDWTPVLKPDGVYCSPACGGGCKKADYNKAVRDAADLCKRLGTNWVANVWENLGWHYAVILKINNHCYIEVYSPDKSGEFWIDSRMPEQFSLHSADLEKGIQDLLNKARAEANDIINSANALKELL